MRPIFTFLLFVFSVSTFAQQDPLFASEGQRSFWFNPASIGTLNIYSANVVGRKQWAGVDGAPVGLQVNGALKVLTHGKSPLSSSGRGAFGFNYRYDQIGSIRTHSVTVPVNFQFKLGKTFLSIGVSPGFETVRFLTEPIIPPTTGPDPILPPVTEFNETQFTMGAGLNWYNHRFSLGISSTHLFEERFEDLNLNTSRHYYLNGSYSLPLSRKFALRGLLVTRSVASFSSFTGIIFGEFGQSKQLTVGVGYRRGGTVIGAITARHKKIYVGYFVEYYNSFFSQGVFSHEVRLAFEIFDKDLHPVISMPDF